MYYLAIGIAHIHDTFPFPFLQCERGMSISISIGVGMDNTCTVYCTYIPPLPPFPLPSFVLFCT
eukprot:NODE_1046_length_508_cov_381.624672_g1036_i0.p1 GENE.NODE_1046_length_508_cov_381.624672_g1036_i0~~NODE_1046_length_508_cov_381.624672_g1036_i0.p1  ORF type:complete len:64 (+),score=5.46 NODE_1046_length_508_cov_381.624672_g1036_i0:303-494(+)